jgi:hypothetical protein
LSDINNIDPVLFTVLRKGTSDDQYVHKVEPQQIQNGKVLLSEIPQKQYRVTVSSSDNSLWYEIDNGVPIGNQYLVDYNVGLIYFDSSHEAQTLIFDYLGIGVCYVNSERIVVAQSNGNVTETLQELIDLNRTFGNVAHKLEPVNLFTDIATTYPLPIKGDMVEVLTGDEANRMYIWTGQTWQWFMTFPFAQVMQNKADIQTINNSLSGLCSVYPITIGEFQALSLTVGEAANYKAVVQRIQFYN